MHPGEFSQGTAPGQHYEHFYAMPYFFKLFRAPEVAVLVITQQTQTHFDVDT